jgi:ribosomal protein S18 acetylase RimI-like enzyme
MRTKVTTYYLEMTDRRDFRPARPSARPLEVRQAGVPCAELNRFLYTAVGGDWYWYERLGWSYAEWAAFAARPELETWIAYQSGTPAGYFELEALPASGVEILSLGLLPQFTGQGLGGALLTAAVERAWQKEPPRVWLHTCSFDHPAALANYQARGFQLFKEVTAEEELPDQLPGPWPGARGSGARG